MSAMVLGKKRSIFDDQTDPQRASPPLSKRFRRCSPSSSPPTTPVCIFSPTPALVERLLAAFPQIEPQVLERALLDCGNDVEAAIRRLNDITMGSAGDGGSAVASGTNVEQGVFDGERDEVAGSSSPWAPNDSQVSGTEWVIAFVNEMLGSTTPEDARTRATNALEVLERSISSRVQEEAVRSFQKEYMMLKEQLDVSVRENTVLKRAVAIQHERQKEYELKNQELQHLKQSVSQYQEQLRVLEVNNCALRLYTRQTDHSNSNSWHGPFHPDIF